jgi:16S rRNA U516 pseudouridylate synthase RsuA-like enzyme
MELELRRLNKYILDSGYCPHREADWLIDEGKVAVSGLCR